MVATSPFQLDRGTIRNRLMEFSSTWHARIADWRQANKTGTESTAAQSFWSHLLRCFGVIPERIDLFERDAARASTGGRGAIDLFWSSVILGEAKSLGRDLDAAFTQAMDYLAGGSISQHEWPKYILVSDFERLHLTCLGDNGWTLRFTIDDVVDHIDQLMFLAGQETVSKREEEQASIHASQIMAGLYTAMVGDEETDEAVGDEAPTNPGEEDEIVQRTSIFMTRVLFLLYGDDAGLWEEDLFYRFITFDTTADSLGARLNTLFQVLNTPENRRRNVPEDLAKFPYVNGSIFAEQMPQEFFNPDMREALLDACRFRWTRISPAVFGAMFQLVKSKEARRGDGEHYTSETNILKVLEPLFLDQFRDEATRLIQNKTTSAADYRKFLDKLAGRVFLDPACGCGNFLVVAYRELRAIETEIIVALLAKEGQTTSSLDVSLDQRLSIDQFHGFELNWWPAKIAETAMFLIDHQTNRELAAKVGQAPERLPITITAHITHDNALSLDWNKQVSKAINDVKDPFKEASKYTYVFGNPPFLGHATRTNQQAAELRQLWGTKDISRLDYVTAWHAKSLDLFADQRSGAFAFVTTNSVTQGDQVPRLFGPIFDADWRIRFAHRTFAWDSEAPGKAAVHCVIIGFDKDHSPRARLWDYPAVHEAPVQKAVANRINAYLVDGPRVLVDKAVKPLSPEIAPATFGNMARDDGNLIVEVDEHDRIMADPVAAQYVRPFRGSRELLHSRDRWCLWLVDLDPADVTKSPILRERLAAVAAFRESSKAASTRAMAATPYLFGQRSQPDTNYLCIPSVVSESRRYFTAQPYPPNVIVSNLAFHVQDPDGLQFALASSSMFITWQKTVGGRLKSDLRFSNTLTWNTFPVPELGLVNRAAIARAGKGILDARALHPERTLAEHYNPLAMDPALIKAHDKLDQSIDRAFGAPRRLTTERQRQENLFEQYDRLAAAI
ncbi:DNA methyltransferase [Arthrobacter castelli]|uniref:DNA methyltransferase n=1 Tax=Arthrobacter castelli TaxID=271431 RepID=UPI00047A1B06|nr:DNA methyltransferase [Arthrobacter castelli]